MTSTATSTGRLPILTVFIPAAPGMLAVLLLVAVQANAARPPVIVIPGSLHATLEVSFDGEPYETLYLNWSQLRPPLSNQRRWIERISLNGTAGYPPTDPHGVHVRAKHGFWSVSSFGNVTAIPERDPWTWPNRSSYATLLSALRRLGGYEDGKTLFAAPYDWRRAPDTLNPYFTALAQLVERVVRSRGGAPVALLAHSAGPSVATAFLAGRSAAWKASHIHSLIVLNGNLGGEIDCLENLWHGGDFLNMAEGVTSWPTAHYRRVAQWSWPITAWCMPSPQLYGTQTLVTLGAISYSAHQLGSLFARFGAGESLLRMWQHVRHLYAQTLADPNVDVACLYGTNVPTPLHYVFAPGNTSAPQATVMGSGDGQQDDKTNTACARWSRSRWVRGFGGADHDSLLADPRALRMLLDDVLHLHPAEQATM